MPDKSSVLWPHGPHSFISISHFRGEFLLLWLLDRLPLAIRAVQNWWISPSSHSAATRCLRGLAGVAAPTSPACSGSRLGRCRPCGMRSSAGLVQLIHYPAERTHWWTATVMLRAEFPSPVSFIPTCCFHAKCEKSFEFLKISTVSTEDAAGRGQIVYRNWAVYRVEDKW